MAGASNKDFHKPFFTKPYARENAVVCDYVWYYFIETEERARQLIREEWFNKKKFIQVIKIFKKRENDLIAATRENLAILSLSYGNYMPALNLVYLAEEPFYNKAKELLSKNSSPAKAEELLDYLNLPLEDNFYKKEEYDLARTKNLKAHSKKYAWITSHYGGDTPYTIEDARVKLAEIDKNKFFAEYAKEKKRLKKVIAEAKKIIGKRNEYLIDALQFIIFYRTHRTDIMNKASYLYIPRLKEIAVAKKLNYEQILFYTIDELLSGKNLDKNIINQRMEGYAMIVEKGVPKCLIGAEYKKIKKIFYEDLNAQAEIRGSVASRGLAKGAVKVIFSRDDFVKLKDGDILVSSMTTPDMVSIMKKASAFVTDEGGITCHAAIIAREMKKPCIIGTKIATQVLKDGDLVEVDANKGIVKKL